MPCFHVMFWAVPCIVFDRGVYLQKYMPCGKHDIQNMPCFGMACFDHALFWCVAEMLCMAPTINALLPRKHDILENMTSETCLVLACLVLGVLTKQGILRKHALFLVRARTRHVLRGKQGKHALFSQDMHCFGQNMPCFGRAQNKTPKTRHGNKT